MYRAIGNVVYGFHGCDIQTKEAILINNDFFKSSKNTYDWLGSGVYFWENDPKRAMEFAESVIADKKQSKGIITEPAVIGVVIDLGNCLDLLVRENIELLKEANKAYLKMVGGEENARKNKGNLPDMKARFRDCAVINLLNQIIDQNEMVTNFDTVRGVFFEGDELYPAAGFHEYSHIQICVRNPNCIKAVFNPRKVDSKYRLP